MSIMSLTITNEIAPRAILAVFEGLTKDPVRSRLKNVESDLTNDAPRRSVFRQ
ncbi:MAG: hypothetical protein ACK4HW_00290 [Roseinatronobacter sp.]